MKWLLKPAYLNNIYVNSIKLALISSLLLFPIRGICQTVCSVNDNTDSSRSKPELIKQGTDEILDCLCNKDIQGATRMIDYMLTHVEDSIYAAFDSYNYPLILYWMKDYKRLIDYFIQFDSLAVANKHKIKPNNTELYVNLSWSLPEVAKHWYNYIYSSTLRDEYKEVLILDLHKRAMEIDGGDYMLKNYSKRVIRFKKKYPKSKLKDYVKKHILHGNSWDQVG